MFWKQRNEDEVRVDKNDGVVQQLGLNSPSEATRTVVSCLEAFGNYAFDVEGLDRHSVQRVCRAWIKHILSGSPPPSGTSRAGVTTNWPSLRRFVNDHRRAEYRHVEHSIHELREVVWYCLHSISQVFSGGRAEDRLVSQQLDRLKTAVQGSNDDLRRAALETVSIVGQVLEDRRRNNVFQISEMAETLEALRQELQSAREEMETDGLTRVFNRRALDEHLKRLVTLRFFGGRPSSLLMVDIDDFKDVNDRVGHTFGDEVLRLLARTLVEVFCRKSDFVARYGGDEFVVVLTDDELEVAATLGERLLTKIETRSFEFEGGSARISLSIGVSELKPEDTPETWLGRADGGLYSAKAKGRNRLVKVPA